MIPSPETSTPWLAGLLLGPIVLSGFLFSGHLAFRGLKSPLPWATAAIGSLLLLFLGGLGLDLLGVPLTARTLGAWLGLTSLAGWWLGGRGPIASRRLNWTWPSWREAWWVLPCIVAFGSILAFGLCDPLSGFDNFFRWNYLALVMQHQGSLAHYPPASAADFRVYPWCDGIPPLVPIANLWIYLGTHSTSGALIVGRLVVELGLTLGLVWHLARQLWGPTGARVAVLVLSTSSLFGWSMGMEQETGLSGVAALALAALILAYREAPSLSTAIWIGLTAAVSALCRDYNLVFIPAALIALAAAVS
ncbi:MAG: glycosyltransferase family 39 protein, partial [Opitutales bacterium]